MRLRLASLRLVDPHLKIAKPRDILLLPSHSRILPLDGSRLLPCQLTLAPIRLSSHLPLARLPRTPYSRAAPRWSHRAAPYAPTPTTEALAEVVQVPRNGPRVASHVS